LLLDIMNEYDRDAVAVRTSDSNGRFLIGYVPRYLARDVHQLVGECDPDWLQLYVERVNRDAPLQNRVLCRMRACWPPGFQPCSSPDFVPIPATATAA